MAEPAFREEARAPSFRTFSETLAICRLTLEARGKMSGDECRALAKIYDYAARSLFFNDRAAFRECVMRLYEVEPSFTVKWPKVASLATRLFGFKIAGAVLSSLVRLRSLCRLAS